MATRRARPRIAIGFAPGGRGNLLASLTPSADEQAAARAKARSADAAQFNAFKRGDIELSVLETYISGRTGEETDEAYLTNLRDGLEAARVEDAHRNDNRKIEAWRGGAIPFADLEKYFQGRLSRSLNSRDREDTQTAISALRTEHNGKQDKSMLDKWKAGQVTNAAFKAYLQGRVATSLTDEDRANLTGAIKGVDDKARKDMDSKMEADYKSGKLGEGVTGVRAYTSYLVKQASRTDITPEEAAIYDQVRQVTEDNYNAQVDSRVYYEYLSGARPFSSAMDHFNKRLPNARPEFQDRLQQYIAQIQDREKAKASAAGQNRIDAMVDDRVKFAKSQMQEAIKAAELIRDPNQRAKYIAAVYEKYGEILDMASRSGSTNAGEYIAQLRNVPNQAKLDIMEKVGKYELDRVVTSNDSDRQVAGSASENAAAIAGNLARLLELRTNPYLSPEDEDRLEESIRKERKIAENKLADARKFREDKEFELNLAKSELATKDPTKDTISIQIKVEKLLRDLESAKQADAELTRASVANDAALYGHLEHDPRVERERFGEPTVGGMSAAIANQRAGERNPEPAGVDPSSIRPEFAALFGTGGHIPSSLVRTPTTPLVVDNSSIADQRAGERSRTIAPIDSNIPMGSWSGSDLNPTNDSFGLGGLDFQMPSLQDYLGNPNSPDAAQTYRDASVDEFGRFNRAILQLR
jgi:hypothetical protein